MKRFPVESAIPPGPSSPARRTVITGIGSVAPVGVGRGALWKALLSGKSAIRAIDRFDASSLSCRVAGQVADDEFFPLLTSRTIRTAPRVSQFALAAAALATEDARLQEGAYAPSRRAVVVGTAVAGWADAEAQVGLMLERGARRINPFIVSGAASHGPGAEVAALLGAQGPQLTIANGCPSALEAIRLGSLLIQAGVADLCVAGGAEAPLSPSVFASLCRTQELSTLNEDPSLSSCPFDRRHSGIVLSEGACFVVLEEAAAAAERAGAPLAEVLGGESSCDAKGLYRIDQTGDVAAQGIFRLLSRYGLSAKDIDYVCSHANSSPTFDDKESAVLRIALRGAGSAPAISSIKGVLGHPFGASGAFQVAAGSLAISTQIVPPNTNLREAAVGDLTANLPVVPTARSVKNVLVTGYGYGGVNSCLLLGSIYIRSNGRLPNAS
ncbi:MAG: beta-ketoacyl-[acyl-carrier-protein] synthase family protein [Deltaproteobacteria bacterium]|nr:beta-ketoacyl-[acyl-carrier-protein] synthase family protein [Deltaproteobacteria bacterium]